MKLNGISALDVFNEFNGNNNPNSVLLESLKFGRYSYVALDPYLIFKSKGNKIWINYEEVIGNPFNELHKLIKSERKRLKPKNSGYYNSGCVGYLGYDLVHFIESIPSTAKDDLNLPDSYLVFPRLIIVLDHKNNTFECVAVDSKYSKDEVISRIKNIKPANNTSSLTSVDYDWAKGVNSTFKAAEYKKAIAKGKDYIYSGNSYQIKLSQRLEFEIKDSFSVYCKLREINTSPFMAYLNFNEVKLISCSPERLLKVQDKHVETSPIGGTYPRGKDKKEDLSLQSKFMNDPKELAEHTMLVDLERNDLGKVCSYGSVKVDKLMQLKKYSHLMHMVTTISGKLHKSKNSMDALKAMFPGGTITGCPKVETMKIIDELEPVSRGPYTGCIGYINCNGDLDMSIIIRTLIVKGKKGYLHIGGGIVADSEAEREYRETIEKGMALIEAVNGS